MKKGKDYIGVGGGCLIVNDKKEVLLIRRAGEVRNEAGWWSKPGGAVGFGEIVKDAMIREMKEELGIDVELVYYLPHIDHIVTEESNDEEQHWVAFDFMAKIVNGKPKNLEPHKCDRVGWFSFNKLPKKLTQTTSESVENYLAGKYIKL